MEQLRGALQREQKGDVRSAGRHQDSSEVLVCERRELIHDDADERLLDVLFRIFVPPPNHQLQVLEQHPAERSDSALVHIDVQGNVQDQLVLDYIFE